MRIPFVRSFVFALLASALHAQGLPPVPPTPPGNPITAAKTNLGKTLFWDEQLGSNRAVACGTCHIASHGGSDPRTAAQSDAVRHPGLDGVFHTPDDGFGSPGLALRMADGALALSPVFRLHPQVTRRKAPSVINAAFSPLSFWDGRAGGTFLDPLTNVVVLPFGAALESQAAQPPIADVEMAHVGRTWSEAAQQIETSAPLRLASNVPTALSGWIAGRDYPALFTEAFGTPQVTPARIAMAIATYERTLISNQAPFDSFLAGNPNALTPLEQQGRLLFNGVGRCNICHTGPRLSNDTFRYIGVRPQNEDLGRFEVTGQLPDRGRMKVPSLRNVELRAPYFHNGELATLADVVDFYNRGGDFFAPNKDPNIVPLGLNAQQRSALVAFLGRPLTDPRVAAELAPFDRPTLYSESNHVPLHYGIATAGSGGFFPEMIALDPPVLGNPAMSFGFDFANGARPAGLLVSPVSLPLGQPFQGATLHVGFGPGSSLHRIPSANGNGPGNGWGSFSLSLPSDPVWLGVPFFAQWLVLDPTGAGHRLSATDAVEMAYF